MSISNTEDTSIRSRFSAASKSYDVRAEIQDRVAGDLIQRVQGRSVGTSLLEVGCGTGRLTQRIVASFPRAKLTALDLSPAMIEQARRHVESGSTIRWRASGLCEFETDERFSSVLSSSALHWITPLDNALRAIDRYLGSGGRIAVAIMLRESLHELHDARLRAAPNKPPEGRLPSFDALMNSSSHLGWEVLECSQCFYTATHRSARDLLGTLHQQGLTGGPVSRSHAPLTRGELIALMSDYDHRHGKSDGSVEATYHVGFLHAIKPES